jgi:DNA helicase-2/ATP-dependent DNA helicase PcrA
MESDKLASGLGSGRWRKLAGGAEILENLNKGQRAAVEHGDGPLLVIAGAGTGKTRVITARICRLLAEQPELSAENILGLTYTKKAAGEMRSRVRRAAGERAEGIRLSTFHSFCVEEILSAEDPAPLHMEDVDHWILLRKNIDQFKLKHFKRLAEPGQFLSEFRRFFSRCQDELVSVEEYANYVAQERAKFESRKAALPEDELSDAREEIEKLEEVAHSYAVSERLMREKRLVTYGAQIMQAVRQLRENPELLAALRARYRYLLVDEFQDTNYAQIELLWLLAGDARNILAVGDDDQAIFRFRGASFGSFTVFMDRFARAIGDGQRKPPEIVSLTENYRSTGRILRAAQEVIQYNERSDVLSSQNSKNLIPTHPPGEKVRICEFTSPLAEAEWIASEIERLRGAIGNGKGGEWSRFAVLYRMHAHRNHLVRALRRRNIPFVVRGLSVLPNTLVRDMLTWLRAIAHPGDDVAFARLMAVPRWGFEPSDLVRLAERAGRGRTLREEMSAPQMPLFPAAAGQRAEELLDILNEMLALSRRATARRLFDEVAQRLNIATLASDADQAALSVFANLIAEWEKKSEARGLRDFLEYFDYYLQAGGELCPEEEMVSGDAVQLMTAHAAKGLEFDQVFVMRLCKQSFPGNERRPVLEFPPELIKEGTPKASFHIQEERRLFFVALTRARRRLTLTTVLGPRKPQSVFLDDLLRTGKLQGKDLEQCSPAVEVPEEEEAAAPVPADASRPGLFTAASPDSYVYSQVALWARAYHPPAPEPLRLSASALDRYERCPMQYLLSAGWHIRGKAHAALTFGSVMHTTLREMVSAWQRGQAMDMADVEIIYAREWSGAGFEDAYQEEEYRRAGLEQLRTFHEKHRASPPNVLELEWPFELALPHNVVIKGRIDRIDRLSDGTVEIVDYKTGSVKKPLDAKKSLQLSIYALAVKERLELEPSRLVFYNLGINDATATTRDAKSLAQARQQVAEIADGIRAGEFPANPGYICGFCDYRLLCPEHEDLLTIHPARAASLP